MSHSLSQGRTPFCTRLTFRKLCGFLLMFSCLCTGVDAISSNIDEVLSINPSVYVFVFEHFSVHYKDWLTYSGGTDRPG